MSKPKLYYSREEMQKLNTDKLLERGVTIEEIAKIAYKQQYRYNKDIKMEDCIESVEKILSLRDIFHLVQLGAEIDRLTEEHAFRGPIQTIMENDLGVFGVDEIFGLDIARLYGAIGQTNFGDFYSHFGSMRYRACSKGQRKLLVCVRTDSYSCAYTNRWTWSSNRSGSGFASFREKNISHAKKYNAGCNFST